MSILLHMLIALLSTEKRMLHNGCLRMMYDMQDGQSEKQTISVHPSIMPSSLQKHLLQESCGDGTDSPGRQAVLAFCSGKQFASVHASISPASLQKHVLQES